MATAVVLPLSGASFALTSGPSWISGGSFTQDADGVYTLTDSAGDNNVSLQIGTGTATSGTGALGITFGTRGNANAVNLSKQGAGATLAIQTGTGSWAGVIGSSYGLNGSGGGTLGLSFSGTVLQLNGAGGVQVQSASKIRSGTGSPESVVSGSPGDLWLRTDGGAGTSLYVKESGAATNTGWIGK